MLHNIVVAEIEPDKYLLISGERRTKAVKLLGRDKIKATIRSDLSELDILKMLFFANSETREYTNEEKIQIIFIHTRVQTGLIDALLVYQV